MDPNKLTIKVFHVSSVQRSSQTSIDAGNLFFSPLKTEELIQEYGYAIKDIHVDILEPHQKKVYTPSIFDIIPISTKVLGNIGHGLTHTLSGVRVLLTIIDDAGKQTGGFGNSSGQLVEKVHFNKSGTPKDTDFLIRINITAHKQEYYKRQTMNLCGDICDRFLQPIREVLKKLPVQSFAEKHVFYNRRNPSLHAKRVVLLKQVAGQGAMYDTVLFPYEPSGYKGGVSIIDSGNLPVFLTANEYRDGAVRAMS